MKFPGILNPARPLGFFAAEKNPKAAALGNSIANKLSEISNRSVCIGRSAGRTISRDIKQFNALTQQSPQKQVRFADTSATKAAVSGPSEKVVEYRGLKFTITQVLDMSKNANTPMQKSIVSGMMRAMKAQSN
ncbi:TPA: hypothetical protein ACQ31I_004060 [Yersinia enterocolitica]